MRHAPQVRLGGPEVLEVKVYTRTGDTGETGLYGGGRASKGERVFEVLGTLDELNSVLGLCASQVQATSVARWLERLQNLLFELGAEVATPRSNPSYRECELSSVVADLEADIDAMTVEMPELKQFILPGGTPQAASLHWARSVCRRLERVLVQYHQEHPVRDEIIQFVNRLSDWLFTAARYANHVAGAPETVWRRH